MLMSFPYILPKMAAKVFFLFVKQLEASCAAAENDSVRYNATKSVVPDIYAMSAYRRNLIL